MDEVFLGFDCGGTNLRGGLVDRSGDLKSSKVVDSPLRNPDKIQSTFATLIDELLMGTTYTKASIQAVGIGTPGPLDVENGQILVSSNLGNSGPIKIVELIEPLVYRKVYLDRDTNVGLMGEQWLGGAQGLQNVVLLSLGSGVGGAILNNGQIERGEHDQAGEIGHTYIEIPNTKYQIPNVPVCGLGHKGCLEAFIKSAKDLDELGFFLGIGLANVVDIFNPEKILISGGLTKRGDFLPQAKETMKQFGMKPAVDEVAVEYAKLGEEAGVIGAAKIAIDTTKKP